MTGMWKTWMSWWCYLTLLFGLVLALVAVPPLGGAGRWVFWVMSGFTLDTAIFDQPVLRVAAGLQGALTIGWIMTVLLLVKSDVSSAAGVWRAITAGLIVWYPIDSAISVITGFPLNAVSNTVLTVTFLIPVLRSGVLRDGGLVAGA